MQRSETTSFLFFFLPLLPPSAYTFSTTIFSGFFFLDFIFHFFSFIRDIAQFMRIRNRQKQLASICDNVQFSCVHFDLGRTTSTDEQYILLFFFSLFCVQYAWFYTESGTECVDAEVKQKYTHNIHFFLWIKYRNVTDGGKKKIMVEPKRIISNNNWTVFATIQHNLSQ